MQVRLPLLSAACGAAAVQAQASVIYLTSARRDTERHDGAQPRSVLNFLSWETFAEVCLLPMTQLVLVMPVWLSAICSSADDEME